MTKEVNTKVEESSIKKPKGFQKNHKKTGGRKPGTPNKRTADFMECLGDFDLVGKLKDLYYQTKDENLKAQILRTLMEYAYPKRKAVEMAADMNINTESIQIELI